MAELLKRTEEFRCETEDEARDFIETVRKKGYEEGYELKSYSSTLKRTKEEECYIVKVTKVF